MKHITEQEVQGSYAVVQEGQVNMFIGAVVNVNDLTIFAGQLKLHELVEGQRSLTTF